uniref:Uncharacterized protein n=1 Tax=Euplotes harpa TaxID=151035 RepID=A0A7S3JAT3_9SPIT|mmetsp:Transcript_26179/g.30255  ORF Transcript_26179/g.30255 Transcript_26179/m.30255 type:complete len:109 (+) Transcript_26179:448-774(+)
MQRKPFYNMNMFFQRKCVKELAQSLLNSKTTSVTSKNLRRSKFPKLSDLIDNPGNKTLIGFEKCSKFTKWQEKHTPFRVRRSSPQASRSTRRSTMYHSSMPSRIGSTK